MERLNETLSVGSNTLDGAPHQIHCSLTLGGLGPFTRVSPRTDHRESRWCLTDSSKDIGESETRVLDSRIDCL